jgi:hypothetical protein
MKEVTTNGKTSKEKVIKNASLQTVTTIATTNQKNRNNALFFKI